MRRRQRSVGGKIGCGNPGRACTTEGMVMGRGIPPSTARRESNLDAEAQRRTPQSPSWRAGPAAVHPIWRDKNHHQCDHKWLMCLAVTSRVFQTRSTSSPRTTCAVVYPHIKNREPTSASFPISLQQIDFCRSRSPVDGRSTSLLSLAARTNSSKSLEKQTRHLPVCTNQYTA